MDYDKLKEKLREKLENKMFVPMVCCSALWIASVIMYLVFSTSQTGGKTLGFIVIALAIGLGVLTINVYHKYEDIEEALERTRPSKKKRRK